MLLCSPGLGKVACVACSWPWARRRCHSSAARWAWSSWLAQSTPRNQVLVVPLVMPVRAWDYFWCLIFIISHLFNCWLQGRTEGTIELSWQHWTSTAKAPNSWGVWNMVLLLPWRRSLCAWLGCSIMPVSKDQKPEFSGSAVVWGLVTEQNTQHSPWTWLDLSQFWSVCSKRMLVIRFLHFQKGKWSVDMSTAVRPVFGVLSVGDCTESARKSRESWSCVTDSTWNTLHAHVP